MARDETEAAYFTLLRAREEVTALHRYGEVLADEVRRLHRVRAEGAALADRADRRLWRGVAHTDAALQEAIELRLRVIADEQRRLPERVAAADAFVTECEDAHAALRRGG